MKPCITINFSAILSSASCALIYASFPPASTAPARHAKTSTVNFIPWFTARSQHPTLTPSRKNHSSMSCRAARHFLSQPPAATSNAFFARTGKSPRYSPLICQPCLPLPEQVVGQALASGAQAIAFTYSEPTISFEYVLDIAKLAKAAGLKTLMVSNGYIEQKPLKEILKYIDAYKVDFKGFDEGFYKKTDPWPPAAGFGHHENSPPKRGMAGDRHPAGHETKMTAINKSAAWPTGSIRTWETMSLYISHAFLPNIKCSMSRRPRRKPSSTQGTLPCKKG